MRYISNAKGGYQVKIPYAVGWKRRFFSWGFGKKKALKMAAEWKRITMEKSISKPFRMKRGPQKNSKSKIKGVCPGRSRRNIKSPFRKFWGAVIKDGNKWETKKFYITRGNPPLVALEKAVSARKKFERSLKS